MNSAAAPGSIGGAVVDLEVIIVGDGLAASAAAIVLAKQNIAFAIIAPRTKIQPTYRIGESLGAGAQDVLRSLGVWEKFLLGPHRPSSQFFTAWGAPLLQRRPEQPGWTLDRLTFDQMMKDAANASEPPRLDAAVRHVVREAGRWRVTTGVGEVLTCRFIIDGSGRAAAVARRLTTPRRYDRLVACHSLVDQTVTEVQPTPATLVESADEGWWYSTFLPSGKALVAWFTDSCPGSIIRDSDAWRTRLATSRFAVPWLESAGFQEAALPMISAAGTVVLASAADASLGWAAAGDAALAVDPLSSHGILSALWMGRQVGGAAAAWMQGDEKPLEDYRLEVARGASRYLSERRAMYAVEQRYPESLFWQRRL